MSALLDLVKVLEAIYAVERPEGVWLRGVMDAIRPAIEDGLGMTAYIYDASKRPLAVREPILDCALDATALATLMGGSSESYVRGAWLSKAAATASETPGYDEHPGVREVFHPVGIHDVMVINALDPVGIGCLVGAPLRSVRRLSPVDRERWERVAAHMQAAMRLRVRLGASNAQSPQASRTLLAEAENDAVDSAESGAIEAVLTATGKVEHLARSAEGARDALRDAVLGIDRAQRSMRSRPDRALASWKALVRARWTLVHDFEAGGERFIVARANGASASGPRTLSERERQVVGCLAMGHSYKVIAYELGLSHSTVRVLVGRARAKLGARSRDDLVAKFRANV